MGEALARTSNSKIAAGVREDNWSEGRLRCRWTVSVLCRPSAETAAGL